MAEDDRTEAATPKKREELRKEGDILRSREVTTAVLFAFALFALSFFGSFMLDRLMNIFSYCLSTAGEFTPTVEATQTLTTKVLLAFGELMAPLFLAVMLAGVVGNLAQGAWGWTTKPLTPKWERLNPLVGLKNLFDVKQRSVDLVKSFLILVVLSWVCYWTLKSEAEKMAMLYDVPIATHFLFEMNLAYRLLKNVLIAYVLIAGADYLIQRQRYEQRIKMTRQEIKDEHRQMEGDPKVKSRIRRLMIEATRRRMMAMVPKADVVITNPTHFAVALMYDPDKMVAPQVVAKGQDRIALRIIEIAEENKITVYRDPPVARALYRAVEPGDSIPADMFKAVAEILAQVYRLTKKMPVKPRPAGAG